MNLRTPVKTTLRVLSLILAASICPIPADAQVPDSLRALGVPPMPVARPEGAFGILANPAGLAFTPGTEFTYLWGSPGAGSGRDATTLLKLGTLGLAWERFGSAGRDRRDFLLASAWRLSPTFSAGWSYRWTGQGADVWSIGMVRRLAPWLLTGLYATDVNHPDDRDPRVTAGLTLDLFHSRLLLSAEGSLYTDAASGIRYGEDHAPVVHVRAQAATGFLVRGSVGKDLLQIGLEISLNRQMGVGGMARSVRPGGADAGRATWLRFGERGYAPLLPAPSRWLRVRLGTLPPEEPLLLFGFLPVQDRTMLDLLLDLEQMAGDPRVEGVLLELGGVQGGWASLQEVRRGLLRLKEAGKGIVVWAERLGMADLYLAACADSVILPPSGGVDLTGLAIELEYFGALLEKIGVNAEFVRIDEYKTAPESYTRTGPTPESLEMAGWLLEDLDDELREALADGRGVPRTEVDTWFEHGPYTTAEGVEAGLIDGMAYPDEMFGDRGGGARGRRISSYASWRDDRSTEEEVAWVPIPRPVIAVVYATGAIVSGTSGSDLFNGSLMGAETVAGAIRSARLDPLVRGIVLRVDSPGGSALASDLIWREVERTARSSTPMIVSMGDVAASGGYYISCGADLVFASPGTITGSIGIFAGKFDLSGLYDKIGYDVVRVERGRFAGAFSLSRGFTDEERSRLREVLEEGYDQFVLRVGSGREMTYEEVDAIGRGRVWTGEQAVENGLVDRLGGLLDAIEEARRQARLSDRPIRVRRYPQTRARFDPISAGRMLLGGVLSIGAREFHATDPGWMGRQALQLGRLSEARCFYMLPTFWRIAY